MIVVPGVLAWTAMAAYGSGLLGKPEIPLNTVDRLLAIGSDGNAYQWSVDNRSPQEVVLPPGVTASSVSLSVPI